jgi:phosphate transport system protein
MTHFQQELQRLKAQVMEMGTLAESMVIDAAQALRQADRALIERVRTHEPILDRFQIDVDREAIRLITIYAPVAKDLRFLLMIVRINSELERIGDQTFDNCGYIEQLTDARPGSPILAEMSDLALEMVRRALEAFRDEDTHKAHAVMRLHERVAALNGEVFHDLLQRQPPGAEGHAWSMRLILVGRSLERIANHATNICEEIFYLVEGADVRHRTPVKAPH